MKLIIDIPEEKYEWVKKNNPNADTNSIVGVIINGTPVSTEGDLISRSELKKAINTYDKFAYLPDGKLCHFRDLEDSEMYVPYIHFDDVIKAIDNAPTISPYKELHDELHKGEEE